MIGPSTFAEWLRLFALQERKQTNRETDAEEKAETLEGAAKLIDILNADIEKLQTLLELSVAEAMAKQRFINRYETKLEECRKHAKAITLTIKRP